MSHSSEWSPDQESGAELFEPGDEAFDEAERLNPNFLEEVEEDPTLDPSLIIDERELEEAGMELDDPEELSSQDRD
jgi:hypothetical protein